MRRKREGGEKDVANENSINYLVAKGKIVN